jgi:predicted  nucleic acid-binding Zn-ribbon protein
VARQIEQLAQQEEAVEKELATVEGRAKQLDDALRAPGSATRDAQAIIHEIDQLKEQAGGLEEQGLELLEQRDALQTEQDKARAELEAVAAEAPSALAAVQTAEGEAGQELAKLESERAELVPSVDATILATYERKRPKLDGVAVARVVNSTCSGCHIALSAADLDRMAKLGPGQHASCEQCDRILIPA